MALDVDHPAVVQEPVEDGRGDHRVSEELLPVTKALVRGDDGRTPFVAVGDELEEEITILIGKEVELGISLMVEI